MTLEREFTKYLQTTGNFKYLAPAPKRLLTAKLIGNKYESGQVLTWKIWIWIFIWIWAPTWLLVKQENFIVIGNFATLNYINVGQPFGIIWLDGFFFLFSFFSKLVSFFMWMHTIELLAAQIFNVLILFQHHFRFVLKKYACN